MQAKLAARDNEPWDESGHLALAPKQTVLSKLGMNGSTRPTRTVASKPKEVIIDPMILGGRTTAEERLVEFHRRKFNKDQKVCIGLFYVARHTRQELLVALVASGSYARSNPMDRSATCVSDGCIVRATAKRWLHCTYNRWF